MSAPLFTNPAPSGGDTAAIAAAKANQTAFAAHAAAIPPTGPYPGGFTTLAPKRGDSLVISLKKIAAILSY